MKCDQMTYAKLDVRREVLDALVDVQRAADERRGDHTLLASQAAEERVRKLRASVCHRKGRTSSTSLGLDDLVTAELHTVHKLLVRLASDALAVRTLREKRHDRLAGVTADDGDRGVRRVAASNAGEEARRADDIERADTEDALRVVHTRLLVHTRGDWHKRVDGVGDDTEVCLGRDTHDCGREITEDRGVRLRGIVSCGQNRERPEQTHAEEIVTGHLNRG